MVVPDAVLVRVYPLLWVAREPVIEVVVTVSVCVNCVHECDNYLLDVLSLEHIDAVAGLIRSVVGPTRNAEACHGVHGATESRIAVLRATVARVIARIHEYQRAVVVD